LITKDFYKSDVYRFDLNCIGESSVDIHISNVISWDSTRLTLTKQELKGLADFINNFLQTNPKVAAYAQINERGDLYDLRLECNPFFDQNKVVPLYRIN
jgi:hypothetical protein